MSCFLVEGPIRTRHRRHLPAPVRYTSASKLSPFFFSSFLLVVLLFVASSPPLARDGFGNRDEERGGQGLFRSPLPPLLPWPWLWIVRDVLRMQNRFPGLSRERQGL